MPEITGQRGAVEEWLRAGNPIDLFFTLHNTETAEYLEGPSGALAQNLFELLKNQTTFNPSRPFSAVVPNQDRGRANVVQALAAELKIPAFLMEQRIAYNPKLNHLPEISDRIRFGGELVQAIHSAVLQTNLRR